MAGKQRQRLIVEEIEEISTVPAGMNKRAHVLFTKGIDSTPSDEIPAETVTIKALDGRSVGEFFREHASAIAEAIKGVISKPDGGKATDEEGKMSKEKETKVEKLSDEARAALSDEAKAYLEGLETRLAGKVEKLSDEARSALSDEAKAYVEGLEAQVADATKKPEGEKPEPTEKGDNPKKGDPADPASVIKGASPEVQAAFDKVQKDLDAAKSKAEEAEKIAKEERDARETVEFEKRAEREIPHLTGTNAEKGKMLRELYAKLPKESADLVVEKLKAGDNALVQLFRAEGRGSSGPTTLDAQVEAGVKEIMKADSKLTKEQAAAKFWEDNPRLYEEHLAAAETEGR